MTKRTHLTPDESCLPLKKRRNLGQTQDSLDITSSYSYSSFVVSAPVTTPHLMFTPITPSRPSPYFFRPWCTQETSAPEMKPIVPYATDVHISHVPYPKDNNNAADTNDSGISESSSSGDSSSEGSPPQSPATEVFSPPPRDVSLRPISEYPHNDLQTGGHFTFTSGAETPVSGHGDTRFDCEDCGRKFKRREYLNRHRRMHTGERPYSCDICGATFSQRPNLWYHKRIHTGESPYECDVCQRKFRSSSHLKRHQRLHTGEKPYACPSCPAAFITWDKLNRHKMLDHQ